MARVPAQTWAAVALGCVLWIALGSQITSGARRHDFLNLYAGASLAADGHFRDLHDPEVQLNRERRFVPELDALVPFVRPVFYAALLAPMALLPFYSAFWIWLGIQTALLFLCWAWAYRRWGPDALIFGALYLPTALGIAHGQDCVVMLGILVIAWTCLERERWFASGAMLSLGLIKPHLFVLWPVALAVQRRWRMLAGLCAGAAFELGLSLLLAGPEGLRRYAALLRMKSLEHLSPSPELMINAHSLALNAFGASAGAERAVMAMVIALALWAAWQGPAWRMFCAATAGSLLLVPHVYGYDAGLLLLPVWLAIYCSAVTATRIAATVLATPIPILLSLAGSPWAAAAPLALLSFLASLVIQTLPTRKRQSSASS